MVHLSRLAEDLILFTSEEFGFFELADTAATGSSLMPQKKNPDPLELVRGKSGRVLGRLTGWLASMKGLPVGYSKDLQEDKEALFEAEDTVNASVAACASVLKGITINRDVTAAAASGLLLATDVADYLVLRGVAIPRCPRDRRRARAAPRARTERIRAAVARRVARALAAVRCRRQGLHHRGCVRPPQAHAAVHTPRCCRDVSDATAGVAEGEGLVRV